MRRDIAKFLLFCLLLAQIGLAEHSSVHVAAHIYAGQQHEDDGNHGKPHHKANELCQICLGAQLFSHAVLSQQTLLPPASDHISFIFPFTDQVSQTYIDLSNRPRGPPFSLI